MQNQKLQPKHIELNNNNILHLDSNTIHILHSDIIHILTHRLFPPTNIALVCLLCTYSREKVSFSCEIACGPCKLGCLANKENTSILGILQYIRLSTSYELESKSVPMLF